MIEERQAAEAPQTVEEEAEDDDFTVRLTCYAEKSMCISMVVERAVPHEQCMT